ncbi:MAG TPA: hypothetical protein VEI57_07880 [Nitrospirota bacterium]|nr:hypothetical protein [Nitrospirota bacterium]
MNQGAVCIGVSDGTGISHCYGNVFLFLQRGLGARNESGKWAFSRSGIECAATLEQTMAEK